MNGGGDFDILCQVCGKPISKEKNDLGFRCSKECDAEMRLVPALTDEIRFQVRLFQPIHQVSLKLDVATEDVKSPEDLRKLLKDIRVNHVDGDDDV